MTNLLAHCDTTRVEESTVMAIPAPEFTDTWHPYSHGQVITAMDQACEEIGLGVVKKDYSVSPNGARMFSAWQLAAGNGVLGYELGIRNATDKSMVIGVTAGTRVFVCDNMCFSGDFITFRKHTGGLDFEELLKIGVVAVSGALKEMEKLHHWQKALAQAYVSNWKEFVFDLVDNGVFSGGQIGNYMKCLEEEQAIRRGNALDGAKGNLFNLHGAATRLMRPWSLLRSGPATGKLNAVCDDYLALKAA